MISWVESCLVESGQRLRSVRRFERITYLIENSNVWAFYPFKPWYNSDYRKYVSTIKVLRGLAGSLVDKRRRDVENDKTGQEAKRNDAVTMLGDGEREDGNVKHTLAKSYSRITH